MTFDQSFDQLFFSPSRWLKKIALRNTSSNSSVNSAQRYTGQFASISKKNGFPFKTDVPVGSCVKCLNTTSGPSAIFFVVTQIVVNSVDAMVWWAPTHILKKILKFFPTFAVCDSPASVVWPLWSVGVVATPLHRGPYSVFCGGSTNRFTVGSRLFSRKLSPKASAANYESPAQSIHCCNASSTAVANV